MEATDLSSKEPKVVEEEGTTTVVVTEGSLELPQGETQTLVMLPQGGYMLQTTDGGVALTVAANVEFDNTDKSEVRALPSFNRYESEDEIEN